MAKYRCPQCNSAKVWLMGGLTKCDSCAHEDATPVFEQPAFPNTVVGLMQQCVYNDTTARLNVGDYPDVLADLMNHLPTVIEALELAYETTAQMMSGPARRGWTKGGAVFNRVAAKLGDEVEIPEELA